MKTLILLLLVGALGSPVQAQEKDKAAGHFSAVADRDMELAIHERIYETALKDDSKALHKTAITDLQSRVDEIFDSLPNSKPTEKVTTSAPLKKTASKRAIHEVTRPSLSLHPLPSHAVLAELGIAEPASHK